MFRLTRTLLYVGRQDEALGVFVLRKRAVFVGHNYWNSMGRAGSTYVLRTIGIDSRKQWLAQPGSPRGVRSNAL